MRPSTIPTIRSLAAALAVAAASAATAAEPPQPPRKRAVRPAAQAASRAAPRRARPGAAAAPMAAARTEAPRGHAPITPVRPGPAIAVRPVKPHARTSATTAAVASVAAGRAYLDAGAAEGLAAGQRLSLLRNGRAAASCTVEAVADHSAVCAGEGARPGDTFAVTGIPAIGPAPKTLPPVVPAAELGKRRAALQVAQLPLVEYRAPPRPVTLLGPQRLEARLVHASWAARDTTALHQERVEARVYGAELFSGWRLFLDASAVYRSSATDLRYRPGSSALLEVRELQLSARDAGRALAVSLGRVLPWGAPGSTAFDGAQVGWRGSGWEAGAFGGLVPDPVNTGLTTERYTGGVYGSFERSNDATLLRGEGRVALVRSPELGQRVEAEALLHAWLARRVDVSGQVRAGVGDLQAPAAIDAARLDVSARLAEPLWLSGGWRYGALFLSDVIVATPVANQTHHADLSLAWDVTRLVTLRGTFGFARDLSRGVERTYFGPEVALPRLFGRDGGLSLGYLEETGWASGRSAWLQGHGSLGQAVRLLARASYYMDSQPGFSDGQTVGLVASATVNASRFVQVGLSGLGRYQLKPEEGTQPGGASVLATLILHD